MHVVNPVHRKADLVLGHDLHHGRTHTSGQLGPASRGQESATGTMLSIPSKDGVEVQALLVLGLAFVIAVKKMWQVLFGWLSRAPSNIQ